LILYTGATKVTTSHLLVTLAQQWEVAQNKEAVMKKIPFVIMSALVILSLIMPLAASAQCKQQEALNACYADCKQIFSNDLEIHACYLGCFIGCAISDPS
jgi:hypothetical protein